MEFKLAKAYPRYWVGYVSLRRPYCEHDFTSLHTVIRRRGSMEPTKPPRYLIRNEVLAVLPYGKTFTVAEITGKLNGITFKSVASMICKLIDEGYPIYRVSKRKPVQYRRKL